MKIKTVYAQDPVFNASDKMLLTSLGIQVVQDPAAFALVDNMTFLYSPGAERSHLMKLLPFSPSLFFGGPLETEHSMKRYDRHVLSIPSNALLHLLTEKHFRVGSEADILTEFVQRNQSVLLPPFGPNEHAFWKMRLYWRRRNA